MPASISPSLYGVAVFQMYILHRPFCPSGGVMKLALLNPDPSWAFVITASFSFPPRPKLYCWKLPATSSKPYLWWVALDNDDESRKGLTDRIGHAPSLTCRIVG